MHLTFLGHSSIMLATNDNRVVYIDPSGDIANYSKVADLILISAFDYDHCSLGVLQKIRGEETVIIGTSEVAANILGCHSLHIGEVFEQNWFKVAGVEVVSRQPQQRGKIGFLLTLENKTVYYTSDTEMSQSLAKIKADVVVVPVGGTLTMKARTAAELVELIRPKVAIPVHWGSREGSRDDAELFKELSEARGETKVYIMEEGKTVTL